MTHVPRTPILVAALVAVLLAAAGAVALAATGGDDAPRHPTVSASPLVSIAQPAAPGIRLGRGAGSIALDYALPGSTVRRGVVEVDRRHDAGARPGHREICVTNGPLDRLRTRGVEGGWIECESVAQRAATPFTWEIGSGDGSGTMINGIAAPDVERLVLSGPGGTYEVPRGSEGAFVIAYSRAAKGAGTLTAYLRNGRTTFQSFRVPFAGPPRVAPATEIAPRLLRHYAILRRRQTAADRYPRPQSSTPRMDVDVASSRLLLRRDAVRIWLVPGRHDVCMDQWAGDDMASAGCGPAAYPGYANGHQPMGGSFSAGRGKAKRHYAVILVPDGTTDARVIRHGRTVRRLSIRGNVIVAVYHRGTAVTWIAPDGTLQKRGVSGPR